MRALYIHADSMEFESKKKTPVAEEIKDAAHSGKMEEVLVVFVTVEKDDEGAAAQVTAEAVGDIMKTMKDVGAERVMIYPYAHLSNDLARPKACLDILKTMEAALRTNNIEVMRAPFGWYKSFGIKCKGHPLSELSRDFKGKETEQKSKGEETFFILTQDGKEISVNDYKKGTPCMMEMIGKEALGKEGVPIAGEPEYLRLCKKFGIQWESMSDVGHMCLTPHGALMFDLVSDYATQIVNDVDVPMYMVKGTNMFSLDEPAVKEHADLFGDRLYTIDTGKKSFILRYAACHQQFAMMRNWNISYKQLPLGAFEVADSYRLEQSGETMLCFRTRRLNMPDLHVVCKDEDEARENFKILDARIFDEVEALGREYDMLINFSSKKAYDENRELVLELCRKHDRPALIHFYPEGINYYWTVNIEYHIIDQMNRAREIGTVQIDIGNAKRFGITYADENGEKKSPVILHTAIIGTIERYLYTLLDTAVGIEKKGVPGYLPVWINPEQVRLMPVSGVHLERTVKMARELEKKGIRVSVDDTDATVGKKVRRSKQDWCSYAAVIGDKESETGELSVYVRSENADRTMTLDELTGSVKKDMGDKPFRRFYMPMMLAQRVDL
ncbi:MAG: threonine--tRNA ligase [Methanomassiliicoccaceae archaeon]|jgi:threonyl-tRNA synthetase|nr:threonine--tRNA ligase [Methanomassiliicoccaceae archaeon]